MATCPESDLTTFASDGLPGFDESYSQNVLKDKRQMNPNEKLLNRTAVCRNNKENHPKSNPVNVSYIFIISVLKLIR